jgi:glycerophosphoryl diester phosphodiesterase
MRRALKIVLGLVAFCAVALFVGHTDLLAPPAAGPPLMVAHRGLGQIYSREGLTATTCTATRLLPIDTPHIENTLPSIRAAFAAGADIVEFDVQPTADGHFVVFHDWTLDCRTNGSGRTRDHTLAALKALDVGYGYTADGGASFPFRGKGEGAMASLDELLAAFPDRRFLINIKSNDAAEGVQLAAALAKLPAQQRALLAIYGGAKPMDAFRGKLPEIRAIATDTVKRCFVQYPLLGWSGYVPRACRDTLVFVPINLAPWFWGFPRRFAARLRAYNSTVVLVGPMTDLSGYAAAIDDRETFARVPKDFDGMIWTNRVDRIATPR